MEEAFAVLISYFIGATIIIIIVVTSLIILLLIYEKISRRIKYGKMEDSYNSHCCKSIADLYDDAYDKPKVPILGTKPRDLSLINIELIE